MGINVFGKTIMKNLFGKPATAMYPVIKKEFYPQVRGTITNNIEACIFCGMCSKRCPTGAIQVDRAEKKWEINRFRCVLCGFCTEVCPRKCLSMETAYASPQTDKTKGIEVFHGAPEPKKEAGEDNA